MDLIIEPHSSIRGEIRVPGDKSISHRAVMCASLASGTSKIKGFLESEDCLATIEAFKCLGIKIRKENDVLEIKGNGIIGLQKYNRPINLKNSGTSMRLISGILAGQNFSSVLIGDKSLNLRPMKRIISPLNKMGFSITASDEGTPPLRIYPVEKARAIEYVLPIASAQIKSCLMFASLFAEGETKLTENFITRDHTERMFKRFGISLHVKKTNLKKTIVVKPPIKLDPCNIEISGDFSSASFFILAALISPNSDLLIKSVGINPTRTALLVALKEMGANISIENHSNAYEPTADIRIKYSRLKGIQLNPAIVPNLIDELPVLFIAAAIAQGKTKIRGAEELRHKESDRLEAMAKSLNSFGVKFKLFKDGIDIEGFGQDNENPFKSAEIDSYGDHRIAMASIIGSLRSKGACTVKNCTNISTSFPGFVELSNKLGMGITKV